ncbi:MAG: FG-GAP repeat domain-containing protein [Bryobacteraceae bacterium]
MRSDNRLCPGNGTFSRHPNVFSTARDPGGFAIGDFNRDGKMDLAVGTPSTITVLTNTTP